MNEITNELFNVLVNEMINELLTPHPTNPYPQLPFQRYVVALRLRRTVAALRPLAGLRAGGANGDGAQARPSRTHSSRACADAVPTQMAAGVAAARLRSRRLHCPLGTCRRHHPKKIKDGTILPP